MTNNPDFKSNASSDDALEYIDNVDLMNESQTIEHIVHHTNETEPKPRALIAALELHRPKSALITCNEAPECELLSRYLMHYGFKTAYASEEHNSQVIAQNLAKCADGSLDVFICQNQLLESHSLEKISFILNYDMIGRPQVYEAIAQRRSLYPRRVVNLITSKDFSLLATTKAHCQAEFSEQALPNSDEVLTLSAQRLVKNLNREANQVELGQFEGLAKRIMAETDVLPAIALLMRHYLLKPSTSTRSEHAPRERREYSRERERPRREHSREPRRHSEPSDAQPDDRPQEDNGITRLYITLGRQDDFHDLADLAQFLSEKSGVDLGHFSGTGMIRDHSAHIEVDADVADNVISALHNTKKSAEDEGDAHSTIVCERARQNMPRNNYRRPPQRRHGNFQRR